MTIERYNYIWYYRLYQTDEEEGLLQKSEQITWPELVICWTPPNGKHFYTRVPSPIALAELYFEIGTKSLYEVILPKSAQKIRFDIDIPKDELGELNANNIRQVVTNTIITHCIENFGKKYEIYTYSSHGQTKFSYHLVLQGLYASDYQQAKYHFTKIYNKIPSNYRHFVDTQVYHSTQQFRILGCSKQGTTRYKVWCPTIHQKLSEEPRSENHRYYLELFDSLITNVIGCTELPLIEIEVIRPNHSEVVLSEEQKDNILDQCKAYFQDQGIEFPYTVYKVEGGIICLKRTKESYCPICRREHSSEGAFIVGNGVFYCRRNPNEKVKI